MLRKEKVQARELCKYTTICIDLTSNEDTVSYCVSEDKISDIALARP